MSDTQPAAAHGRRAAAQPRSFDHSADALWAAVGARDGEEVTRLLARGADPNMICNDGVHCMHIACAMRMQCVRSACAVRAQCVRSACAVRARCKSHVHSPLSPSRPCVAGWVRAECAPKDGGVGRSVLHHAAWAGDLSIFQSLVEAGADVSRQRNTAWRPNGGVRGRGATPLHHAVMYNRRQIVDYMLNTLGVPVDLPGEQGCTGLVNVPSWRRCSLLPRPPRTRGLGSGLLHASRSSAQATET